jgi:DNA-binding NtrC family response regulator
MNAKHKVLVIDDDAVVGRSFDRVLSEKGYEVNTALSGEEGLEKMDTSTYDVVFTDIKMPGMDGLQVAERIRERCPWTPVVVITGYGSEENEAKAKVLGTKGFVRKPLTPEIIESVTLKALTKEEQHAAEKATAKAAAEAAVPAKTGTLRKVGLFAKNVGLFLAAPFIGLAYVIALPFVFFGMVTKLAFQALTHRKASS